MSGGMEDGDQDHQLLLRLDAEESAVHSNSHPDEEELIHDANQHRQRGSGGGINDLITKLKTRMSMDRGSPSSRLSPSFKRNNRDRVEVEGGWKRIGDADAGDEEDPPSSSSPPSRRRHHHHQHRHQYHNHLDDSDPDGQTGMEALGDPPEWALLLIGCLLGLASGLCVAAFNRGVSPPFSLFWVSNLLVRFVHVLLCFVLPNIQGTSVKLRFCLQFVSLPRPPPQKKVRNVFFFFGGFWGRGGGLLLGVFYSLEEWMKERLTFLRRMKEELRFRRATHLT